MFTGKRFKLTRPILGFDTGSCNRGWVEIPIGAIITVRSGPYGRGKRLAYVLWDSRPLAIFGSDLTDGATELAETAELVNV